MKDEIPKPEHLEWVIGGRARNQRTTLKLYRLFVDHPAALLRNSVRAQLLAAVAFSLWRAVFLADRTAKQDAKNRDVQNFLATILTDNAINFTQDRRAKEWTFVYYYDSALLRLEELRKMRAVHGAPLRFGKKRVTTRQRWEHLQAAFDEEVQALENEVCKRG